MPNSTHKKLVVQWLNEALFFVSRFVVVDSFRFRNRQLLVAANRCRRRSPGSLLDLRKGLFLRMVAGEYS
ncbi:hypothetical protein DDQ68_02230 [Hymenobacter nivis]|uniref:Uncharacterized protein n=1 Tax=Hymenobacter nivis TaxID=1850093 RepID=A0A2Z3GFV1_9BACT|nr:hypothetical protein DDQ68_02230 [Hymenobacter nivis]